MTRNLILINEVMSVIDSFQQDYGTFRYSVTIQSYAMQHQLTVNIVDTKTYKIIRFEISEIEYEKAMLPSEYIYNLIKVKTEDLAKE